MDAQTSQPSGSDPSRSPQEREQSRQARKAVTTRKALACGPLRSEARRERTAGRVAWTQTDSEAGRAGEGERGSITQTTRSTAERKAEADSCGGLNRDDSTEHEGEAR